jgi:hypothetical protein
MEFVPDESSGSYVDPACAALQRDPVEPHVVMYLDVAE